jgi:hypothetical protein
MYSTPAVRRKGGTNFHGTNVTSGKAISPWWVAPCGPENLPFRLQKRLLGVDEKVRVIVIEYGVIQSDSVRFRGRS